MSSVLRRPATRVETLTDADHRGFVRLVAADPLVNATVAARLRTARSLSAAQIGDGVLGVRDEVGRLAAAVVHAGNLVPIGGGPAEWTALGSALAGQSRRCTSIVGRADAVETLWHHLAVPWGPARTVRERQPLLVLDRAAAPRAGDHRVRAVDHAHLDRYLEASAAMFTAELGIAPQLVTGAAEYRGRVAGLIRQRRALGIVDQDGSVLFKADLGAVSADTCQVAGVWVRPDQRGRGVGTAAFASVLRYALALAPTASLYVNDFNLAARRMYARFGMREVATLATVLF